MARESLVYGAKLAEEAERYVLGRVRVGAFFFSLVGPAFFVFLVFLVLERANESQYRYSCSRSASAPRGFSLFHTLCTCLCACPGRLPLGQAAADVRF